jgi:hypothetical protein
MCLIKCQEIKERMERPKDGRYIKETREIVGNTEGWKRFFCKMIWNIS